MKQRERGVAIVGAAMLVTAAVAAAVPANADTVDPTAVDPMAHIEVGVPGEDVSGYADAGVVEVRYSGGTTRALTPPAPQAGSWFGSAIAAYDYDNDERQDLFVGAPGRDIDGKVDAGAVYVFHGTPSGLTYEYRITMDNAGLPGAAQAGAEFGASLFHDTYQENGTGNDSNTFVQIGAPGYDVGAVEDAGAVLDLDVNEVASSVLLTEADWTGGQAQAGDRFGTSITENDLIRAIGAPGKTVNGQADAGAIYFQTLVQADVEAIVHQDSPGMPGAAEAGDRFGRALTQNWERIYIGVPGEDIGTQADAGYVSTILDNGQEEQPEPGPSYRQDAPDEVTGEPVSGLPEAGDRFGAALGWYQRTGTEQTDAAARIYVGVPGEDMGELANTGMVNVLHHPNTPALSDRILGSTNEAGDQFGATVFGRHEVSPVAVVGVPGEDNGMGAVQVIAPTRLDTWTQNTGAREAGDNYGGSIHGSR